MSIASETQRITNAKAAIKAAVEAKGISVGDTKIDGYAQCIEMIPTGPTYEGQTTINENGTVSCAGMLMANDLTIDVKGGIEGAACGKFTWDGNYPVYCDCSALETAPTAFMLYCPYFVNLGTGDYHALIAAKGVGTSISTAVLRVTAKNIASVGTYQTGIVYDAENKAVKLANSFAGTLMSGQDYYWIAV